MTLQEKYQRKISAAYKTAEKWRIEAQLACKHENVAEAPYVAHEYGSAYPPFRVCIDCGFAERGWSCGYKILTNKTITQITRKEGHEKLILGPLHPNARFVRDGDCRHKPTLYRRAVMCEEMIDIDDE